jgi:UDP-glucuronate decarboxylase
MGSFAEITQPMHKMTAQSASLREANDSLDKGDTHAQITSDKIVCAEPQTQSSNTDAQDIRDPKNRVTTVGHESVHSNVGLETLRHLYLPKDPSDRIVHNDGTVSFLHAKSFLPVRMLRQSERLRILVTGGAGFVGSHLVDRLMLMGHEVIVLDNFFTGTKTNVQHWIGHPHFDLVRHDVVDPFMIEVNQIYHLACPASPPHYQYNPTKTVKTSVMGTINMLGLAKRTKARFLLTSTSGKN